MPTIILQKGKNYVYNLVGLLQKYGVCG